MCAIDDNLREWMEGILKKVRKDKSKKDVK